MDNANRKMDKDDPRFVLLTAEYASCRTRYEDIYKAIWTQFNYFVVAVGALLAFGKDSFGVDVIVLLACIPLLFWFWATFEPLNRYADQAADRAKAIELTFNWEVFQQRGDDYDAALEEAKKNAKMDPAGQDLLRKLESIGLSGMWHFTLFCKRREEARLTGNDGAKWREDCGCRKLKSGTWLVLGTLFLIAGCILLTQFRLQPSKTEHQGALLYCGGILNQLSSLVCVSGGLASTCISAYLIFLGVFRERARVGVRTFVRLAGILLHIAAFTSLSIYYSKIHFEIPTGPNGSAYELSITQRDGKLFLIGPRKVIDMVKAQ